MTYGLSYGVGFRGARLRSAAGRWRPPPGARAAGLVLALGATSLALALAGAGRFSVDGVVLRRDSRPPVA